ncbi:MAG: phosphate ABC transporter permease PstA [Hyphomicrobiaceae bacterium]|nr:phosphate ABC transporter permease PstA [Hyphomicrobiaceae bacterium]
MSDVSSTLRTGPATGHWRTAAQQRRLRRRYAADRRMQILGLGAIGLAVALLGILFGSLVYSGYLAFAQTRVVLEFRIDPALVQPDRIQDGNFRSIIRQALFQQFPEVTSRRQQTELAKLLSPGAEWIVRDHVQANPELVGRTVNLLVPVADPYDQLSKGVIPRDVPESQRRLGDEAIGWLDSLDRRGLVRTTFAWELFLNADSRFPEMAGLAGAMTGSFLTLLVCLLLSIPLGIAAAVYLEEFAPKNRLTSLIEVNINNLAAVPSIVFGLLGLAVFLGFLGLPRSAPLVGGMVLSLITLPTIVIATRATLKAVPPSIREAALAIGASKHQVMMHHVLPMAMPGIMTATIIGLAHALGETAPLLLIGMNAFIPSVDSIGLLEPATALPMQIYSWADSPERGFVARTSAAILVLLGFLVAMNAVAIYLRQRFERTWS